MLEKMLAPLPSPKADPRTLLRAHDRSQASDRADDAREDGAGGFGQALAADVAARQSAQKSVDPRTERPRHERRSDAGKPEPHAERAARGDAANTDETACVMNGEQEVAVDQTKKNPLLANSETPACRLPGEHVAASEDFISVGTDLPSDLSDAEVSTIAQPELPAEVLIVDLSAEKVATVDPSGVITPELAQPDAGFVETATVTSDSSPLPDAQSSAPASSGALVVTAGAAPLVEPANSDVTSTEDGALAVSLDGQRKTIALQAGATATIDASEIDATTGQASSEGQALPGSPVVLEAKTAKTSVPSIPLETTASAKAGEGKGFAHHAEAISGPASGFAELIRDFAPHQGMGGLRAADPMAALDRSGAFGLAQQDTQRPTPLQMLPIEMGMQAMRGNSRFQIRLDPPELGRVDVKLEISSSGEVKANMVVDRVETLAILRRDSHSLQYAFEQAGLKQAPDGLTFSLRGEGQNGQQAQDRREDQGRNGTQDNETALLETLAAEKAMRRVSIPLSRIDLVI